MNGTDLIVLAPWVVFAVGLAVVWRRVRRSRRIARRASSPAGPARQRPQPRRTAGGPEVAPHPAAEEHGPAPSKPGHDLTGDDRSP
jgi:hypothetical protein